MTVSAGPGALALSDHLAVLQLLALASPLVAHLQPPVLPLQPLQPPEQLLRLPLASSSCSLARPPLLWLPHWALQLPSLPLVAAPR